VAGYVWSNESPEGQESLRVFFHALGDNPKVDASEKWNALSISPKPVMNRAVISYVLGMNSI